MYGKFVQILGIPMEDGFQVTYGLDSIRNTFDTRFGTIKFKGGSSAKKTYIQGEYTVTNQPDCFKDVDVFCVDELRSIDTVDYLLVFIPFSAPIETNVKRLTGRYYYEGIFEMFVGDTITVCDDEIKETYVVVQEGNDLFLVKH